MFNFINSATFFILMVIGVILIVCFLVFKIIKDKKNKGEGLYQRKQFLTQNEQDCYRYLMKEFPDYLISVQVSMGAILTPKLNAYASDPNERSEAAVLRNQIGSKIVDFVLINKDTMNVAFIIELDDKSHDVKEELDKIRDKHLALAGIYTVRFRRVNNKFPSRSVIDNKLRESMNK